MKFALPTGGTARIDDTIDAESAVKSVCAHSLVDAEIARLVELELERGLLRDDMEAKRAFAPMASADYHLHQVILRSWDIGLRQLVLALADPIVEHLGADRDDIEGVVIEELGERIRHRLKVAYRAVPDCPEDVFARPRL
jgi:hypothetical protein